MRQCWTIGCLLILLGIAPGCVVMKVGAQNPIPAMTTIAVVPFFNLSQEPNESVDGRRFALAYYAELQKTPGFEVIPVGVTEAAILSQQLDLRRPDDALKLCQLLNADAVVVGAVTDYDPYYPPRIGLQVDWYSPYPWYDANDGTLYLEPKPKHKQGSSAYCPPGQQPQVARAQSPEEVPPPPSEAYGRLTNVPVPVPGLSPEDEALLADQAGSDDGTDSGTAKVDVEQTEFAVPTPARNVSSGQGAVPEATTNEAVGPASLPVEFDPRKPLMSYTRMFDGADHDLVNQLRDYLELRGDLRSGGWQASLQRSEDFIRFTAHVMIVEMLSLHGGAVKSQIVLKWRKYR